MHMTSASIQRRPRMGLSLVMLSVTLMVSCFTLTTAINGDVNFGYVAATDVGKYLKLATDIQEMRIASTMDDKKRIYTDGNHSSISLASLSLTAADNWKDVPIYNLFLETFRDLGVNKEDDSAGSFDGHPVEQYADTLVRDLFLLKIDRIEGTGAVVLNVLMSYWGNLWRMLQGCKTNDMAAMNVALDTAVALWVGEGQIRNDNQKGYFLYSFAEFAGSQFGQDSGETLVNSAVLETFLLLQENIKDGLCAERDGYESMRNDVQSLIQYSNIMLVQMLLHHIQDVVENDSPSDFVELFSLAVNPQIEACDTEIYNELTDLTIANDVTAASRNQTISFLQSSYSCLGITCEDVGAYLSGIIPACKDRNGVDASFPLLAQYPPSSDVRDISNIDRDIRQMRIFMELGSWAAATDYYEYGWHSEFTLEQLATDGALSWTASEEFALVTS